MKILQDLVEMTQEKGLQWIDDGVEGDFVLIHNAVGVEAGLFAGIRRERTEPVVNGNDG